MGERKEYMIAGKTHSEIVSMMYWTRIRWYKTISFEDKEEAMKIVEIARRIRQRIALVKKWKDPEYRDKHIGKNHSSKRPEVISKIRAWWTPERRAERSASMMGHIVSEETRAKIGVGNTGKIRTEEDKIKYSVAKTGEKHPMYGMTGEKNPNYIDGRLSDPQYQRRGYLRRLGLPNAFIELALCEKKKRTDIELMMEHWLINNGINYEFQRYIDLPSTFTKVDFFIQSNICLYCDGNHYHEQDEIRIRDERITKELESMGYRVIRIWGNDIHDGVRPWGILEESQSKYEQQSLE